MAPEAAAALAWIGAREHQEDSHLLRAPNGDGADLCILADGMGGHAGGAVASRIAVEAFDAVYTKSAHARLPDRLKLALDAANQAIGERAAADPSLSGMGCTLVGAVKTRSHISWISVGDSPMWLLRGGGVKRLNSDHSVKGRLEKQLRRGEIDQAAFDAHGGKQALTSAVTGRPIPEVDLRQEALQSGDRIIIASDGVETLRLGEIAELSGRCGSAQALASALVEALKAKAEPHQDNATVLVLDHVNGDAPRRGFDARLLRRAPPAFIIAGLVFLSALVGLALFSGDSETEPGGSGAALDQGAGVEGDADKLLVPSAVGADGGRVEPDGAEKAGTAPEQGAAPAAAAEAPAGSETAATEPLGREPAEGDAPPAETPAGAPASAGE